MTNIIDGKAIAAQRREQLKQEVATLPYAPGLAVVLVGDDPASQVYVRNKVQACEKTGIESFEHVLPADSSEADVAAVIKQLNKDDSVHGILLQLPLPKSLNSDTLIQTIDPAKDVDGLTHVNLGKLVSGEDCLRPCTPSGCEILLKQEFDSLAGKVAVVIGRSVLFGKPMGQMLLDNDCTVLHCHSKTDQNKISDLCQLADILIVATGQKEMVKAEWVKEGAFVVDVGINRNDDGTLSGDVDFNAVASKVAHITPVPGGVGPMTIAMLLENTVKAAKQQNANAPKL